MPIRTARPLSSGDTARPTSAPGSEDQRTLDKYALSSAHLPTFSATPHSPMARDAIIGNSLTPTVPVHAGPPASPSHVQNHTVSPPPASTASRMDAAITSSPGRYPEAAPGIPNRPGSLSLPASRRCNSVAAPRDHRTTT
ncbi:hypothetical protein BD779DRAFT_1675738 [Infundibulicybe gibba]|nr:hypothetical protein BD779DRAFT_1675738 [Infundibulicybe gibba]